jgi:predicted nucleic acid-binding protein
LIVLDASSLIAHLDRSDAHHDRARQLLLSTADDDLAASPITLAEVFVGPARAGQLSRATAAVQELGVRVVALGDDAPTRLALLRTETGLKLPDCCVLLASDQTRAAVATFDDRLAAAARNRGHRVMGAEPNG